MVGKPEIAYCFERAAFFAFSSGDCFLPRGKSISTRTNFFEASANSGWSKTSFFRRMHQPHQSLPVKSTKMSFFSAAACFFAASRSVSQVSAAKSDGSVARRAKAERPRRARLRGIQG